MNPLIVLKESGQSIWYDNIRRSLMTSGELERMMAEMGVTGVTSNPTIFEKAINSSAEYDGAISRLASRRLSTKDALESLVIEDIALAADILRPAYDAARGEDGYVSIEVNPLLAHDAKATVKEARRLHALAGRDNLMIKVPATVEGVKAIEELTCEGYNVNVTLLFSVERYEKAATAYLAGLERRARAGKPLNGIFSVASFFVSRVDTLADKVITELAAAAPSAERRLELTGLTGKIAVASAKLAYLKSVEIFSLARFRALKKAGARRQKLLWGSTGTKNPQYSDVKYVEELIAPGTINTMPLQTMMAFKDHGMVAATLAEGTDEARRMMDTLPGVGVNLRRITDTLEHEGVAAFSDSYNQLLECIEKKKKDAAALRRARAGARRPGEDHALGGYVATVDAAVKKLDEDNFSRRLWEKDATIWKKGPSEIRQIRAALGWLGLPKMMNAHVSDLTSFAESVKADGFTDVVLLGMGGSSLAPIVYGKTFGRRAGFPALHVLDSTDPGAVSAVAGAIAPGGTLFIVSSKSGSTIEPISLFEYFYDAVSKVKGKDAGENFIAITDAGTALEGFSRKYRFRRLFLNPADIGGRFSALSYFGLVPAALIGVDIRRLLSSASTMEAAAHPWVGVLDNPGLMLGAALGALYRAGRDKITFILPKEIECFGLWIEQLLAESTGKDGKGLVPVTGEPLGAVKSYSSDRVFVHIWYKRAQAAAKEKLRSLSRAGHPVLGFCIKDLYGIGAEFMRWEIAVAAAGAVMGLNPFDQPDVELSKRLTIARLNMIGKRGAMNPPGVKLEGRGVNVFFGKRAFERLRASSGFKRGDVRRAVKDFIGLVHEGDYVGLLAYFNPDDKMVGKGLASMRRSLMSTRAATEFGWGPRYLHSTGQLHKGGGGRGAFIIVAHTDGEDVAIPSNHFSFRELELSQAFGDMEALDSKGRNVMLIDVVDSSRKSLDEALSLIKAASPKR